MTYYAAPGVLKSATRAYTFEEIEKTVCEYYSVDLSSVYQKCRRTEVVLCRQIIAYFALEFLKIGVKKVGELVKRNYTTVVYCRIAVNNYIDTDPIFKSEIEELRKRIKEARFY